MPWSRVSEKQLQSQLLHFEAQLLRHMNKSYWFECKVNEIKEEARSRGIKLSDLPVEFFRNQSVLEEDDN